MKNSLFFACFLLLGKSGLGQCPTDFFFYSQSLIDNFSTNYPNCHKTFNAVRIEEGGMGPITNLHGLKVLDTIVGKLHVLNTHLTDMKGLDSLRFVSGEVKFEENQSLASFTGLEGLRRAYSLRVFPGSPLVQDMHGFDGLERLDHLLELSGPNLKSLEGLGSLRYIEQAQIGSTQIESMHGLENLDTVRAQFVLTNMKNLKTLAGLENLKHAAPNIGNCDSLVDLHGLEGLESGWGLFLYENSRLESLDGLENFKTFDTPFFPFGGIFLGYNPELNDLSALDHELPMHSLFLLDNPKLATCSVRAICDYLAAGMGDTTSISGNLPNCNSEAEVLGLCTSSTGGFSENRAFEVAPNPLTEGVPLQILLENDFLGKVKFELFTLDGRVASIFEMEKTAPRQVFEVADLPTGTAFFVRVSDEKGAAARPVFRF